MHIAFLILSMEGKGGTERITSLVSSGLHKQGYEVSVISCRNGDGISTYSVDDGVALLSLHGEKHSNPVLRKAACQRELMSIVKSRKIDVLVAVEVALYNYLLPIQLFMKTTCIAWEHSNCFWEPDAGVKYGRRLAAKHADCVVVIGKNDLKNYRDKYSKIKQITCIYNPLSLDRKKTSPLSEKRVLALGRLEYEKGFDMLIRAWAEVEPQAPDWTLNIYGEGSLRGELEQEIRDLSLKHVFLPGHTTDVEGVMCDSSLFVLSSRRDGFVTVLLEAQANGPPCVTFNCKGGPAEIIDDGVNGILVPPEDVGGLARGLLRLINDPERLQGYATQSQKDLDRFSPDIVIGQWDELIKSLTSRKTK